jgi:hypothetical protein
MKKTVISIFALAIFVVGCTSTSVEEIASDPIENPSEEVKTEVVEATEEVKTDDTFTLKNGNVIGFTIGANISSEAYTIKESKETRMTEEGPEEETLYTVSNDNGELVVLKPGFDIESGAVTGMIGEIVVKSTEIKTDKGIGVGSTISEFTAAYPNHRVWYTYVSDMYVIESDDEKAQFLLNKDDFTGKLDIKGDMTTLKVSDFKPEAKITSIRVL